MQSRFSGTAKTLLGAGAAVLVAVLIYCVVAFLPAVSVSAADVVIATATLPPGAVDAPYSVSLQAKGGVPPYRWKLKNGWLPAGLQLQPDGTLTGAPQHPGEFRFTVETTDSTSRGSAASKELTLQVPVRGLSIITSNPELPWGRAGVEYEIRFTAWGGVQPYRWSSGPLPAGLSLRNDGTLSGTPREGGDFTVRVTVTDLLQTANREFRLHLSPTKVDRFGGVLAMPSPKGGDGRWRVEKIGNRWVFVTPDGNGLWMQGVWFVSGDSHQDERRESYDARTARKYGRLSVQWVQANRRLRSWGFNVLLPYSYRMVLPDNFESDWKGTQPVKFPFVWIAAHPAFTGRNQGVFKNLFAGIDFSVKALSGQRAATFPDVFDAAWVKNTYKLYAEDKTLISLAASPYFMGAFSDDTDYLSGFGSGTDFPTDPPEKKHTHLGYIALVTAPEQAVNQKSTPAGVPYADRKVYTKFALRDFLQVKYGTIAMLNAAWGSSYTTFDRDGGWPNGNGLLDENGRSGHSWLGTGDPHLPASANANPKMVADLDEFLYRMTKQLLSVERAAYRQVVPHGLFFGPTTIGAWWSPARPAIYRAAAEILDVVTISGNCTPEQMEFAARAAGDVPMIIGIGAVANADSSRWREPNPGDFEHATWNLKTQTARGQRYRENVQSLFKFRAAASGSHPVIGILWWAWNDSLPEHANFGLVSQMDNAYDGVEGGITGGIDAWGYPTGGEEKNFGNFLGAARETNFWTAESVAAEGAALGQTGKPARRSR